MAHRRGPRGPFGHIGSHRGGRTLNAYERARPDPASRDLYEGLNEASTEVISKPFLDSRASRLDLQPENLVCLGSYTWVEATVPSIIVPGEFGGPATLSIAPPHFRVGGDDHDAHPDPGSPRIWVDKPLPISVPLDHGYNFIDQNGHRMGSRTLFPLIRAVQDVESQSGTKEKFDWSSADIVTDRNGLRKLLRWILANPGDPPRDFRIDLQLAGSKTVLMNRWEQFTKEEAGTRRSYGFNFEEIMTNPVPGCERGTGYHRIITYVGLLTTLLKIGVLHS